MVLKTTVQREEPVIATILDRAGIVSPRPAPPKKKKKNVRGIHGLLGRMS